MDVAYQVSLITGAARDYQEGLMSLQTLIHKVEGLLAVTEERALARELSDAICDLEDVNAHAGMPDYDFEARGKLIVERAVRQIIAKTESYLAK
jgi:hypothetical protein